MPFTFSHPLFSVPLKRIAPRWLSVTGLVLGSMIPDMEYFMALEPYQTIGHSLEGLLLQGVPLSIAFAFAFHRVIKPALPRFMPSAGGLDRFVMRMSSEEWKLDSVRAWTIFLVSLFIGYWSHMFMDAWTHASGTFVGWFSPLRGSFAGKHVYQLLQYLFSLIGAGVPALMLLIRYIRWRSNEGKQRKPALASYGTKALLWLTAAAFGMVMFAGKMLFSSEGSNLLSVLIVAPLSSGIFGIFIASLLHRAAQNRKLKRALIAAALMLAALAVYDACKQVWAPELALDPSTLKMKPPKGVFQPLWNVNLWCWAAMILLSSTLIADNRRTRRANMSGSYRTPTV